MFRLYSSNTLNKGAREEFYDLNKTNEQSNTNYVPIDLIRELTNIKIFPKRFKDTEYLYEKRIKIYGEHFI